MFLGKCLKLACLTENRKEKEWDEAVRPPAREREGAAGLEGCGRLENVTRSSDVVTVWF